MSFKITIEQTTIVTKIVRGEHTIIGEEQEEAKFKHYQESGEKQPIIMKKLYGYAPDREDEVKKEVKVFEQVVEELNLSAVIKAINNL